MKQIKLVNKRTNYMLTRIVKNNCIDKINIILHSQTSAYTSARVISIHKTYGH